MKVLVLMAVAGGMLLGASPAEARSFAYVSNADADTVKVFDTGTHALVKAITGFGHPIGIAVSPSGDRVLVGNLGGGTVSIVDAFTNSIIASPPVGTFPDVFPGGIAFHPTQPRAYVAAGYSRVAIIDMTSNTMSGAIAITPNGPATTMGLAISPNGQRLYVTQPQNGRLNVVDTTTESEITTVSLTPGRGLVVDATGSKVYIGDVSGGTNQLAVLDATTNTLLAPIPLDPSCSSPMEVARNSSGSLVYVACATTSNIAVVDTASATLLTTIPAGPFPFGVALTPDENHLFAANTLSNTVSVVDLGSSTVVDTLPTDDEPQPLGDFIGPDLVCGNAVLEPGEECDDGNLASGDACDPSCRVSCGNSVARAKIAVSKISPPSGDEKLVYAGDLTLPGAPPLNPMVTGLRMLVKKADDTALLDVTLPGGAFSPIIGYGWTVNAAGDRWIYRATVASPPGGVFRAIVKSRYAVTPGGLKFTLKSKNGAYPLVVSDLPLNAFVVLDAAAPADTCGEATFDGISAACTFNGQATAVRCR